MNVDDSDSGLLAGELVLVPLCASHATKSYEPLQDLRIYYYIRDEPPESLEALRRRYAVLERGKSGDSTEDWLNWVVYPSGKSQPLGTVQSTVRPGESADIAYIIFPAFWDRKYARAAMRAVISHVFARYALKKVIANVDTCNERSIRMVEALGLRRVRTIKDADHFRGRSSNEYVYETTATAWMAETSA